MNAVQSLRDSLNAYSRRGHFIHESGLHSDLWIDLDDMLTDEALLDLWAGELAARVRDLVPQVVCGPMTGGALLARRIATRLGADFAFTDRREASPRPEYRLPTILHRVINGRRVLVVDDAVNAGSAIRGTLGEISKAGGTPAGVACLLALNDQAQAIATASGVHLECLLRMDSPLWDAAACPVCQDGSSDSAAACVPQKEIDPSADAPGS